MPASRAVAPEDITVYRSTIPKAVATLEVDHSIAVHLDSPSVRKWYPPKRLPAAPSWLLAVLITAADKLFAYSLDSVAMEAEHLAAARCQIYHIKGSRPAPIVTARRFVDIPTVIPHCVDRLAQNFEMFPSRRILDPIAIGQYHEAYLKHFRKLDKKDWRPRRSPKFNKTGGNVE